jgi:hypothetical protein
MLAPFPATQTGFAPEMRTGRTPAAMMTISNPNHRFAVLTPTTGPLANTPVAASPR